MPKIVIAGGTGFIGQYIAARFRDTAHDVVIISRKGGDVHWNDRPGMIAALDDAEAVINLAGKSVNCRYTEANKAEILRSRVDTTQALGDCILQCKRPPKLWINSGTATIYRHAEDRPMSEKDGEIGTGFSVNVAQRWEQAFSRIHLPGTRQIVLRMAIVLGKDAGVMRPLATMTKLGLGGKQGKGTQMFSWVHIEDLFQIVLFLMQRPALEGIFNCSSPNPVTNEMLMRELRKQLNVPIGLPAPAWLLEMGALFIGTETELILKSRWVVPGRLLEAGFSFQYPKLSQALQQIVKSAA